MESLEELCNRLINKAVRDGLDEVLVPVYEPIRGQTQNVIDRAIIRLTVEGYDANVYHMDGKPIHGGIRVKGLKDGRGTSEEANDGSA